MRYASSERTLIGALRGSRGSKIRKADASVSVSLHEELGAFVRKVRSCFPWGPCLGDL